MDLAGCFLKFGDHDHLLQLHERGLLYCNPIHYFTQIEDEKLRGDDFENVVETIYMESGEVLVGKPEEIPIKDGVKMPFKDAHLTSRIVEPFGNLFCLYCINLLDKPIGEIFTVDQRMKEFGGYFLLINETHEFLRRIKTELDKRKMNFKANIVTYLNLLKHTGKKSVFQKHIDYQYQQEYRIFIKSKIAEPITIEIGSIEEISLLCKSDDIQHFMMKGETQDGKNFRMFSNLKKELD